MTGTSNETVNADCQATSHWGSACVRMLPITGDPACHWILIHISDWIVIRWATFAYVYTCGDLM